MLRERAFYEKGRLVFVYVLELRTRQASGYK